MSMPRRFFAAFAACLLCASAAGAERLGRFTLDVKIDGAGQQAKPPDHSKFSTDESLHLAFTLVSSGIPEPDNRLEEAGSNLVAMQKVAIRLAQQNTGAVNNRARGAGPGRYLTYSATSATACRPEYRARVRSGVEGAATDVHGQTPFTQTSSADFQASPVQILPLCTAVVVADTTNHTIFVYPPNVAVRGKVLRIEGGRPIIDAPSTTVRLTQEALDWVVRQLQAADRSGKQRTTLRLPAPAGELGEKVINVEMRWSFDAR